MTLPDSTPVEYRVSPQAATTHCVDVECSLIAPQTPAQLFGLPVWIPGSYMVREFARHVVSVHAFADQRPLAVETADKARWRVVGLKPGERLRVRYTVYVWEDSVRAAFFDEERLFFNGTSLFFWFEGHAHRPCRLWLRPPMEYATAPVFTTLPRLNPPSLAGPVGALSDPLGLVERQRGEHGFEAPDYDTLVDHPLEIAALEHLRFDVHGVVHEMALTPGYAPDCARLADDLRAVCQVHARFWGELPFERYLFLVRVHVDGYGGLEHAQSTALQASPMDLPFVGMQTPTPAYRRFLGLCSHEYFHAWLVKRLRPKALAHYDYFQENHTRLLWLFEGFTAYYDDLALLRAKLISPETYLDTFAEGVSGVFRSQGRHHQTLSDASFQAWVRYYRPNENSPNVSVSYYQKGALLAFWLDLRLRALSAGHHSLDAVMRALWAQPAVSGIKTLETAHVIATVAALGGEALAQALETHITTCTDPDMEVACADLGLSWNWAPDTASPVWLGARHTPAKGGGLLLTHVLTDSPAQKAGLWAGDELIALDGLRLDSDTLEARLARQRPNTCSTIAYFRAHRLRQTTLTWAAPPALTPKIGLNPAASPLQKRLREAWTSGEAPPLDGARAPTIA